jgi:hypothetical protein
MASGVALSGCGGAANIMIPNSLKAPCRSTVDVSDATVLNDLSDAILAGDADLRECSLKKEAVIEIAESQNRRWYEFWR